MGTQTETNVEKKTAPKQPLTPEETEHFIRAKVTAENIIQEVRDAADFSEDLMKKADDSGTMETVRRMGRPSKAELHYLGCLDENCEQFGCLARRDYEGQIGCLKAENKRLEIALIEITTQPMDESFGLKYFDAVKIAAKALATSEPDLAKP